MTGYSAAGNGLKKVFVGEILAILGFIPLLGGILALVGGILILLGLNEAGREADGYRTAFLVSIISIVVSLVGLFLPGVSLIGSILSVVQVYLVCVTTSVLLETAGDPSTAAKGQFVWKLYAVCSVIILVCGVLALLPGIALLAGLLILPTAIASIVAGIQYLIFLYRAYNRLLY